MQLIASREEAYSRFARHGRLHRLFLESGDTESAKAHFDACLKAIPEDPSLASLWRALFALPDKAI